MTRARTRARRLCDRACVAGDGAAAANSADAIRNVFDLLCSATPHFAAVDGTDDNCAWCGWEQQAAAVAPSRKAAAAAPAVPRWADAASQRRAFSEAWLSFLRLELPLDIYKARRPVLLAFACVCLRPSVRRTQKVLAQMHVTVVPHLTNPLLLSDFLTRAINLGSMLGMLALNGLFLLMTQHGLEYVQFYVRLYGALGMRSCVA